MWFFESWYMNWCNNKSVSVSDWDTNIKDSIWSPLSWEQAKTQMDTVCRPLPTCSSNICSSFLDFFDIFRLLKILLLPCSSSPHSCLCYYRGPLAPSSSFPPSRGSQLRIIAFDSRGLWLRDWVLAVESTGSIPLIPPFGSYCAWWQCWHSTCSPTGLIKSAASIWMEGQRGPRQHRQMYSTHDTNTQGTPTAHT